MTETTTRSHAGTATTSGEASRDFRENSKRGRPVDLRRLDLAAVRAMLRTRHPEMQIEAVRVLQRARCGDGVASTADRLSLGLRYPGGANPLPERMILKTLLLHPALRFGLPAILGLSRAARAAESLPLVGRAARSLLFVLVGLYQRLYPHAPDAMYLTEVRFYGELRTELQIEAPRCFGSLFEQRTRQFGVLMEDLGQRSARFPDATEELPIAQLKKLLSNLAALHAHFWKSPRLDRELAWVPTRLEGGMFPVFDGIGRELIQYQVQSNDFKRDLLAPLGRNVDQLWQDLWRSQRQLDQGPRTLLHGDTHIANTYLLPDGSGGLLDWQLMVRGHWANDFSYLVTTALRPESRRRHERELLAYYLQALRAQGVARPPRLEQAWHDHRLAVIWGLVIGWLITPPVNYGVDVTHANISRLVSACLDLASFDALDAPTIAQDAATIAQNAATIAQNAATAPRAPEDRGS